VNYASSINELDGFNDPTCRAEPERVCDEVFLRLDVVFEGAVDRLFEVYMPHAWTCGNAWRDVVIISKEGVEVGLVAYSLDVVCFLISRTFPDTGFADSMDERKKANGDKILIT
jgi:hypothetical protein